MIKEYFTHEGAFAQALTDFDIELYNINYGVILMSRRVL